MKATATTTALLFKRPANSIPTRPSGGHHSWRANTVPDPSEEDSSDLPPPPPPLAHAPALDRRSREISDGAAAVWDSKQGQGWAEREQQADAGVDGEAKADMVMCGGERFNPVGDATRRKRRGQAKRVKRARALNLAHCHGGRRGALGEDRPFWRKVLEVDVGHLVDTCWPIVNPDNWKRHYWDMFLLLFVIYNAVVVPYDAGYGMPEVRLLSNMEFGIDALFTFDILYNFRTAYRDNKGMLVQDPDRIAKRYISGWFCIDVLASIPFDAIVAASGINAQNLSVLAFFKTPRLLRLGRLLRFLDKVKNANLLRIVQLMMFMMMIAHWINCVWYMLYRYVPREALDNPEWMLDSIPSNAAYLDMMHRSFLLMTGDNIGPLNNVERLACCMFLLLGTCFYATVVGNMALLLSNLNATAARHKQRMDMLNDASRYLALPDDLHSRVQQYYDYLSTVTHPGSDLMDFMSELPRSTFDDIADYLYSDNIMRVSLFEGCEMPFMTRLTRSIRLCVFMSGEIVFRYNDVGKELFIISRGHVSVINGRGEVLSVLEAGEHFGELALLATERRTANCVALANCDLSVLSNTDLQLAMKDYPQSAAVVGQRRVSEEAASLRLSNMPAGLERVALMMEIAARKVDIQEVHQKRMLAALERLHQQQMPTSLLQELVADLNTGPADLKRVLSRKTPMLQRPATTGHAGCPRAVPQPQVKAASSNKEPLSPRSTKISWSSHLLGST